MLTSNRSVLCNRRSRTVGLACLAAKRNGSNLKLMSSYQRIGIHQRKRCVGARQHTARLIAACPELIGVFALFFNLVGVPELHSVHTYHPSDVRKEWPKGGS